MSDRKQRQENPGRVTSSYLRHLPTNVAMLWVHQWIIAEVRARDHSHFPKAIGCQQASGDISDSTQSMCVILKGDNGLMPVNSEWMCSFYMQP